MDRGANLNGGGPVQEQPPSQRSVWPALLIWRNDMQHRLTQAELCEAVEYWLNKVKLASPVNVETVKPESTAETGRGSKSALHVIVKEAIPDSK